MSTVTVDQIAEFLAENPNCSTKAIVRHLGGTKTGINSLLYNNRHLFQMIGETPPLWSLNGQEVAGTLSAAPNGRDNATETNVLIGAITELLLESGGSSARKISADLGVEKKRVNSVLHGRADLFKSVGEFPPIWFPANADLSILEVPPFEHGSLDRAIADAVVIPTDKDDAPLDQARPKDPWIDQEVDPEVLARFVKRDPDPRSTPREVTGDPNDPLSLYDWQAEALRAWERASRKGIVEAVTGAGKTRLALAAISQTLREDGQCVVVVPTIPLLHQWKAAIIGAITEARVGIAGGGRSDDLGNFNVIVSTINTARDRRFALSPDAPTLLVVDECHRAGSEQNQRALDHRFERRLGLSATYARMDGGHETALLPYFVKVVYTLGYRRAIDDDVVAQVRTGFVGVDFSEEERDRYLIISETLISLRKKLISDWGCQSSPFSAFLDDVLKLLGGPMAGGMLANKWLSKWSERRELLAETPAKQQALLQMLPAIEAASKTLIFTQSIASAEAIAEGLRTVGTAVEAHHSQITRVEQAAILERFALGDCRVLVSVRTLEEGIDVPDADLAIIVATSKQRRQMVQRMGRVMRRKSDGRDARFILLYVRFTDEDPRFGAEEGFIEELVGVARESDLFDLPEEAERFVDFLDPSRR